MSVLQATNPTLLDLARLTDPNGQIAQVVEILNETNEVLQDMTWVEGNLATGHRTTVRTGIPAPTWRKIGEGVQPTKSTTVQITANTGMLENYAEIDKALADLNGNTAEFRLQENRPIIEGFNQEITDTLFFGNEGTEPEAFTGFSPIYANLTADANSDNVINALGVGSDNASIWLIVWGPNTIHGIIPKGSNAGLQMKDLGEVTLENAVAATAGSGRMQAYRTHFRWDAGLVVRDWRYAVRICNIDKSALSTVFNAGVFASPSAHLPELMFQAIDLIPNMQAGRPVFYMHRGLRTTLRQQIAAGVQGATLTVEDIGGKRVTSFDGVPIRRVDALSADEAALT